MRLSMQFPIGDLLKQHKLEKFSKVRSQTAKVAFKLTNDTKKSHDPFKISDGKITSDSIDYDLVGDNYAIESFQNSNVTSDKIFEKL